MWTNFYHPCTLLRVFSPQARARLILQANTSGRKLLALPCIFSTTAAWLPGSLSAKVHPRRTRNPNLAHMRNRDERRFAAYGVHHKHAAILYEAESASTGDEASSFSFKTVVNSSIAIPSHRASLFSGLTLFWARKVVSKAASAWLPCSVLLKDNAHSNRIPLATI